MYLYGRINIWTLRLCVGFPLRLKIPQLCVGRGTSWGNASQLVRSNSPSACQAAALLPLLGRLHEPPPAAAPPTPPTPSSTSSSSASEPTAEGWETDTAAAAANRLPLLSNQQLHSCPGPMCVFFTVKLIKSGNYVVSTVEADKTQVSLTCILYMQHAYSERQRTSIDSSLCCFFVCLFAF